MTCPDAQDALMSAGARGCAAFPPIDVPERVVEDVRRIAEAHGVERVVLFGSRARGTNGPRSDVDLAVWGPDVPAFADALDDGAWTLLSFDVVDMSKASPGLVAEIEEEGVTIHEEVR